MSSDFFYEKYTSWIRIFSEGIRSFLSGNGSHPAFTKEIEKTSSPANEFGMLSVALEQWPRPGENFVSDGPTIEQYLSFAYAAERYFTAVGDKKTAGIFRIIRSAPADSRPTLDGYMQEGGVSQIVLSDFEMKKKGAAGRSLHSTSWMRRIVFDGNANACLRFAHPMMWPVGSDLGKTARLDRKISKEYNLENLIHQAPKNTWIKNISKIEKALKGRDFAWRGATPIFGDITFEKLLFAGSNLSEIKLRNLKLINADMRKTNIIKSELKYCKFIDCNFADSNMYESDFSFSDFYRADFLNANLSKSNFSGSNFYQCDFEKTQFEESIFKKANLSKVDFDKLNISKANFSESNLSFSNLEGKHLKSFNFYNANLSNANLSNTNLLFANFSHANLENAKLNGSKISGADFSYSNLSGVDLSGISLRGVHLLGAVRLPTDAPVPGYKIVDNRLEIE